MPPQAALIDTLMSFIDTRPWNIHIFKYICVLKKHYRRMKILQPLIIIMLLASVSCSRPVQQEKPPTLMEVSKQELATAIEERDKLMRLVRLISDDMEKIRRLESGLSASHDSIDRQQSKNVIANINAIKNTLSQRRQQLNELETLLQQSAMYNDELQGAINALHRQLAHQSSEINNLRSQLTAANEYIGELSEAVDSLSNTVTTVTHERNEAERAAASLETELNTCYYIIASKSQLKDYNILETGFLRRSRLMEGDYDIAMFRTADKRSLDSLSIDSHKARLLTNHPDESYMITARGDRRLLTITDPSRFWSLSNFLVIQID